MEIENIKQGHIMESKHTQVERTLQPFPLLPAFPVAATVLSFVGYQKQAN